MEKVHRRSQLESMVISTLILAVFSFQAPKQKVNGQLLAASKGLTVQMELTALTVPTVRMEMMQRIFQRHQMFLAHQDPKEKLAQEEQTVLQDLAEQTGLTVQMVLPVQQVHREVVQQVQQEAMVLLDLLVHVVKLEQLE
jgi:hypothetical protein